MPPEDSDKRTSNVTGSVCSGGHGKSETGLAEPVRRRDDDDGGEFISSGVDGRGSDVVDVDSTSEVVLDGERTGDVEADVHRQRINEDCSPETSVTLSVLDIDLVSIL